MKLGRDTLIALAVVAAVAGGLSLLASTHPDGLEYVAARQGFEEAAGQVFAAPVPDYAMPGIGSPAWATALAGLAGAAVVFLVAWAVARATARVVRRPTPLPPGSVAGEGLPGSRGSRLRPGGPGARGARNRPHGGRERRRPSRPPGSEAARWRPSVSAGARCCFASPKCRPTSSLCTGSTVPTCVTRFWARSRWNS